MSVDMNASIQPKSDQLNSDDLLTGPKTFTIEKVTAGDNEQPVNIHLQELPGRPYKPSKSMRRVIVSAWGDQAVEYTGRQLTLYRNPEIRFGGMAVGGIEISHLSHLDNPLSVQLMVSRGKRKLFKVYPLESAPTPDWDDLISQTAGDPDRLRQLWTWAQQNGADKTTLDRIQNAAQPQPQEEGA